MEDFADSVAVPAHASQPLPYKIQQQQAVPTNPLEDESVEQNMTLIDKRIQALQSYLVRMHHSYYYVFIALLLFTSLCLIV